ncbi:hypothetical protein [Arthrobacter sp. AZCC_0090]|uniref:hypothetical protein n=1 Tax=Arthrobacter sp. AZCC_0090 TaxID=2735881 RepID=UPI00160E6CA7|nr:hypothetical protein [Arthrobacter sp. AZCC_0090]MBB6406184.1 hypothetical protein [Arthrobacter sp. AZCC_0090]
MDQIAQIIGPLIGFAVSLVGFIVAVDQVTASARLRRQVNFWHEQSKSPSFLSDAAVGRSLERDAAARLLALQAVPGWKLLFPVSIPTAMIWATWQAGTFVGTIPRNELTFDRLIDAANIDDGGLIFLLPGVPMMVLALLAFMTVFVERARVRDAYLEGKPLTPSTVSMGGNHLTAADVLGHLNVLLWLPLSTAGSLLLALFFGITFGMRGQPPTTPLWPEWLSLMMMGGVVAFLPGIHVGLSLYSAVSVKWQHPRPLPSTLKPHRSGEKVSKTRFPTSQRKQK